MTCVCYIYSSVCLSIDPRARRAPALPLPPQASASLPGSASSKAIEVWFFYTIARMFLVSMVHTAVYRADPTVRAGCGRRVVQGMGSGVRGDWCLQGAGWDARDNGEIVVVISYDAGLKCVIWG